MFSSYHIQLNKNCTSKAVSELAADVEGEFEIAQVTGCLLLSLHCWLCGDGLFQFPLPLAGLRSQCYMRLEQVCGCLEQLMLLPCVTLLLWVEPGLAQGRRAGAVGLRSAGAEHQDVFISSTAILMA